MSKFDDIIREAYSAIGTPQQNTVQPQQSQQPAPVSNATPSLSATGNTSAPATPVQQQNVNPNNASQAPVPGVQPGALNLDPNTNRVLQNVIAKQGKGLQLTPEEQKLIGIYNQKLQQQNQLAQRAAGTVNRIA